MVDQRRHPRFRIHFPVRIDAPEKPDRVGVTQNVSASGMLVSTRSQFDLGQSLELTFRVTREGDEQHVRGRVVRLGESWEHFFPRRVAVVFERALPDIEPLLAGGASA